MRGVHKRYTVVQNRAFEEIPRFRVWDTRRCVQKDVAIFFWSEWKPISLYMTFCSDFEVTDVVDSSIGSGAVAICALYNQCHDVGACYNNPNMVWVRCLLQQCFMALVSDGKKQRSTGRLSKKRFSVLF